VYGQLSRGRTCARAADEADETDETDETETLCDASATRASSSEAQGLGRRGVENPPPPSRRRPPRAACTTIATGLPHHPGALLRSGRGAHEDFPRPPA